VGKSPKMSPEIRPKCSPNRIFGTFNNVFFLGKNFRKTLSRYVNKINFQMIQNISIGETSPNLVTLNGGSSSSWNISYVYFSFCLKQKKDRNNFIQQQGDQMSL
jgi:hypothetical protein